MARSNRGEKAARRPSQRRSMATYEAILEAAARILEREGLGRHFTTNRIAREAGVGIGSLYEYFDGKEAVMRALGERHVARVRALVDHAFVALRDEPFATAIGTFVASLFALHDARADLQRVLQREYPTRFGPDPYGVVDRYVDAKLSELLRERLPSLPREACDARAFVAVRACRAVTTQAFAEGLTPAERERVHGVVASMLAQMLSA